MGIEPRTSQSRVDTDHHLAPQVLNSYLTTILDFSTDPALTSKFTHRWCAKDLFTHSSSSIFNMSGSSFNQPITRERRIHLNAAGIEPGPLTV